MEFAFTFPLVAGLHARPAALLQEEAGRSGSSVQFINGTRNVTADAKSTFALLSTMTRHGDQCLLRIEGKDERRTFERLRMFVERVLPHCDDGMPLVSVQRHPSSILPRALRGAPAFAGNGVSPGIGMGPAFLFESSLSLDPADGEPAASPAEEWARFTAAVEAVAGELEGRLRTMSLKTGANILRAHLSLIRDQEFAARVHRHLTEHSSSAGAAVREVAEQYAETLHRSDSVYLQERASDIRDIASRLLRALYGERAVRAPAALTSEVVCVAESLTPTEFLGLERRYVKGLVLERGEATSHLVILARAGGIPCVTGVKNAVHRCTAGQPLIVDARRGLVFGDPAAAVRDFFATEQKLSQRREASAARCEGTVGTSADGKKLEVGANCNSVADAETAHRYGADGIGVFRTEIAFGANDEPPDEQAQTDLYTSVLQQSGGQPVIFRTFDVGGDKPVRWLSLPAEENPFLGYRAIRMYDDYPGLIEAQIKAILRAAVHGPARIMLPMIASLSELRRWKEEVRRCSASLTEAGVPHNAGVPVGIMVEIPSAALAMDHLCAEAEFFSIGSNDLTQYLLAVDRGNERVAHLYASFHPALLRMFRMVIEEAHKHRRWVGICGEMAGIDFALPLFLGLGFDEISVVPALVPKLKGMLRRYRSASCAEVARASLDAETPEQVETLLRGFLARPGVLPLIDEDLIRLDSPAESKAEVIRELLGMLEAEGRVTDLDAVDEAVWQREDSFPTGMEYAIALPHCKSPHVLTPSVAIARLQQPVQWSDGDTAVSTVILIAVPQDSATEIHLKIIASLARSLMHEEFRAALFDAPTREGLVGLIMSRT